MVSHGATPKNGRVPVKTHSIMDTHDLEPAKPVVEESPIGGYPVLGPILNRKSLNHWNGVVGDLKTRFVGIKAAPSSSKRHPKWQA